LAITDSIGRALETSAPIIGREFAQALMQHLPKPIVVKQADEDREVVEQVRSAIEELEKRLGKTTDEQLKTQKEILRELRESRRGGGNRGSSSSGGSGRVVLPRLGGNVRAGAGGGFGGGGGGGRAGGGGYGGNVKAAARSLGLDMSSLVPLIAVPLISALGKGMDSFLRSTGVRLEKMTEGVFADEFRFASAIKKRTAETRDYGQAFDDMAQKYHKIGDVVAQTGSARVVFQEAYLKTLKKGYQMDMVGGKMVKRNVKDQQQLLKNSLSTAFSLGMEAQSTAEMFDNWQRNLRLTKTELFQVGFSMRDIARSTGVTSDAMGEAVQASQALFEKMKKTGSLRFSSMETVLKLMATGGKYGVQQLNSELAEGLSSFSGLMDMQNQELQAFINRATAGNRGQSNAIKAGMGLDESVFPDIGKSLISELQRDLGHAGLGGMKAENIDSEIKNLQNQFVQAQQAGNHGVAEELSHKIMNAEQVLKRLGIPLGQVEGFAKSLRESIKTPQDKIEELNQQLKLAKTNTAKKNILEGIQEIEQGITRKALSTFQDSMAGGANTNDAFKAAQTKFNKTGMNINNIGDFESQIGSSLSGLQGKLGGTSDKLLDEHGFQNMGQLQKSLLSGNKEERAMAMNAYEALENAASVQDNVKHDPIMQINLAVAEINENLKQMSASFIFKLTAPWLMAIMGGALASKVGSAILGSTHAIRTITGMFGGRGTKAIASLISGGKKTMTLTGKATGAAGFAQSLSKLGMKGGGKLAGKAALGAAKGGGRLAGAAASGGALLVLFAAIDGAMGGWEGYAKTADIFGKALKDANGKLKEATWGMKLASTVGGALIGIIDGLTLGFLDILGLKTPLMKIFSWISYTIINPIENLWNGLLAGFNEAYLQLKPALDEAWKAFDKLGPIWDDFFKTIGKIFNMGDLEGTFDFFNKIWKTIGPAFLELGKLLGWVAGQVILRLLIPGIKFVAAALIDLSNLVVGVGKILFGVVGGVWNVLQGLFGLMTGDQKMVDAAIEGFIQSGKAIWGGAAQALMGLFAFDKFNVMIDAIKTQFYDLYMYLVGGSLIPDLVNGIMMWMSKLPGIFFEALLKLPGMIASGMASVGASIMGSASTFFLGIWETAKTGFSGFITWILETLNLKGAANSAIKSGAESVGGAAGSAAGSWLGGGIFGGLAGSMVGSAIAGSLVPQLAVGTMGLKESGLAFLHAGEVVIPSAADPGEPFDNKSFSSILMSALTGPIGSGVANTGAFDPGAIKEAGISAMGAVSSGGGPLGAAATEIGKFVGVDINNVIDSIKETLGAKPQGGATKALYMNEEDTDNIDSSLTKSLMATTTNSPSVSTNMFTPEDAADYVYAQLEGSKPSGSEATGILDLIASENQRQTELLSEVLSELRKGNLANQGGGGMQGPRTKGESLASAQQSGVSGYQHELLRGNWEDLQAIPANRQDNLQVRHR